MMFRAMLIKEVILLLRDKHALAALFIMPSIFILIMSLALKDTMGSDRVLSSYAVVDQDNTVESDRLQSYLLENRALQEHVVSGGNAARQQQVLNGTLHFVISIHRGFSENLGKEQAASPLLHLSVASDVKQEVLTFFKGN